MKTFTPALSREHMQRIDQACADVADPEFVFYVISRLDLCIDPSDQEVEDAIQYARGVALKRAR